MDGRDDWNGFFRNVHTSKNTRRFRNPRQALFYHRRIQMVEMQKDMISIRSHSPALTNFYCHGTADYITAGQVLCRWRIPFHKALTFGINQKAALSTYTLGDQTTRTVNTCWVKLHKFHILQWQSSTQHHGIAVTRASMGRRATKIRSTVTASGQYN